MGQMRALLTRFGQGCKVVITGDTAQGDAVGRLQEANASAGRNGGQRNGLTQWLTAFGVARRRRMHLDHIGLMRFTRADIMRAQVVADMFNLLDRMRPDAPIAPLNVRSARAYVEPAEEEYDTYDR